MNHPDLFSDKPTPMPERKNKSFKEMIGYRKAKKNEPSCRHCPNLMKKEFHGRNYYKCEKLGDSNSKATDVRLSGTCKYHPDKL
jgi:hypothetical protein